jgi:hypothetical protein
MMVVALVASLALGQSAPYVRSRVSTSDTQSQCLFWTSSTIPWQQSSVGNPLSTDAQRQREFQAIRNSVASWQRVFDECGNLGFSEGPLVDDRQVGYTVKGDNRNLFLFRSRRCTDVVPGNDACWEDDSCGNAYDCWDSDGSTIALTLTTYDEKSGIIYDSDIQLNASGFVFTTSNGAPCTQPVTSTSSDCVSTDVQNTMTHELGHLVGLDHTLVSSSVMYPRAPPGEVSKRTIDKGSHDFVCLAYPKGGASQSCFTPALSELETRDTSIVLGPRATGCSSTGGPLGLVALAGVALLRRARRHEDART